MVTVPPSLTERLRPLIDARKALPGALLPILHAIQDELGFVPDEAVPLIATALKLSRAEVHGVITFYHHFRTHPPGRHVVQICRAESCQSMGAAALEAHAKASLGIGFHETTADGAVTLEPVYCLGNCACSPAIRVDDEIVGRVDATRFDAVMAELSSEAATSGESVEIRHSRESGNPSACAGPVDPRFRGDDVNFDLGSKA